MNAPGGSGLWRTDVIPERTSNAIDAYRLLRMDGVAILEWPKTDVGVAEEVTRAIFGEHLRAFRPPVQVVGNPVVAGGAQFDWATRTVNSDNTAPQSAHIDGYMMYGEAYPDYILLLCEAQSDSGGESFVVDCQRLIDALAADPGTRDLASFIWSVPVENSQPNRPPMRLPVASHTPGGRVSIRRHEQQRLLDDTPADPLHSEMLRRWFELTDRAVAVAPRFRMQPGDVFCLDNYRVLHGREPFRGGSRLLHRVWVWSDTAIGVPDVLGIDADLLRRSSPTADGRQVFVPTPSAP